jgi:hypothetical protein
LPEIQSADSFEVKERVLSGAQIFLPATVISLILKLQGDLFRIFQ